MIGVPSLRLALARLGVFRTKAFVLCSNCFQDQGIKLEAAQIGVESNATCRTCGTRDGRKLDENLVAYLAYRFFVQGTIHRCEYGAAPLVQFNEHQTTSIDSSPWFTNDLALIAKIIGVGFFYYGPRLWMVGEVEPLKELQEPSTRHSVIERIIRDYPALVLKANEAFYRIRKSPASPSDFGEYDSPPIAFAGSGRLDSVGFPVMYGSQDLQICIHECRVTAEDDLFLATLSPMEDLKLLDLTELLHEEHVTEFESLDMAIHMLFLAGKHSYGITREIALSVQKAGYNGIAYPSYFSLLRTGGMPFETTYGISHRRVRNLASVEKSKIITNLALFGRPIEERQVTVKCINKLSLNRVEYGIQFGPVGV